MTGLAAVTSPGGGVAPIPGAAGEDEGSILRMGGNLTITGETPNQSVTAISVTELDVSPVLLARQRTNTLQDFARTIEVHAGTSPQTWTWGPYSADYAGYPMAMLYCPVTTTAADLTADEWFRVFLANVVEEKLAGAGTPMQRLLRRIGLKKDRFRRK